MATRRDKDIQWLIREKELHKGKWLTLEAAERYRKLGKKLVGQNSIMAGERRKLCELLIAEYGVTDLEAINIVNGVHIMDYVKKYERIQNLMPLNITKDKTAVEDDED